MGNLIKEIRGKFGIQTNTKIEIKVYDKKNNKYFSIDKSEMREIPKGGLIKIVRSNRDINKPKSGKNKTGKSPMKPPGVPPYSKADDAKRNSWKKGSKVEIYSEGQKKWQKGEIVKIFTDQEGEWLVIKYSGFRTKEIQRFSNYIRAIDKTKKTPKKEKKPEKITTQSKYRKKPRLPQPSTLQENEIQIKGNTKHIKKYIDRACRLLT